MGDRGTFKPNDSLSSHSKDSMSIITRIVNASKEAWKYIPEKDVHVDAGTFVELDYRTLMSGFEHIRETIEEWEAMCDELDDDIFELRKSFEALAGNCPYRSKYCDYEDCASCDYPKKLHETENFYMTQIQELSSRIDRLTKELECVHQTVKERNQTIRELREEESHWHELAVKRNEELGKLWEMYDELKASKIKESNTLKNQITDLIEERDYYQDCLHKLANRACNFCGNCKYFEMHAGDVGVCARLKEKKKYKVIDPDDASCSHFKSNDGVVIGKPEFPCCEHCSHEDCDDCTLCPF